MILYSTVLIYVCTLLVHLVLLQIENGRDLLGITMGLPLIIVFIYQGLYKRQKLVHTLAIVRPKGSSIAFSLVLPVLMGLMLHTLFTIWGMKYLYQQGQELVFLVIIGLTISSLSALLEEVVWRGNFHYYLRQSYSLQQSALIIAAIWSIWHLPIGLLYKGYSAPFPAVLGYLGILFVLSILLSYIRELGHSTIPAAILHGMFNVFYLGDGLQMSITIEQTEWSKLAILLIVFMVMGLFYRRIQRKLN